jgi:hypothetical protein
MKKTKCVVAIVIGLAFALPPTLVMARTYADKSAYSMIATSKYYFLAPLD